MDFNSGGIFNQDAGHGGFFWNGAEYKMIVNIREVLNADDKISEVLATLILNDSFSAVYDSIASFALYDVYDDILVKDDSTTSILCELMDSFGLKDDFTDLIVLAFLNEDFKLIEDAKMVAALLQSDDNFLAKDDMDIHAFYDLLEQFNMKDFEAFVRVLHYLHDSFDMTDTLPPPQVDGADWMIGVWGSDIAKTVNSRSSTSAQNNEVEYTRTIRNIVNGGDDNFASKRVYTQVPKLDPAFDYLLPFGLKVDPRQSSIQVSPPSELVSVESPGVDGSMITDVVFKDRLFSIVAYSELGLTQQEKEDLKTKIVNLLASTKNQSKSLLIQSRETKFDVRYQGEAKITEGPSFLRAEIPLWASVYGRKLFSHDVVGSGLLKNDGSIPVGPRIYVIGPCNPFSFVIGGETYSYSSSVPNNSKLFIDFEMKSVWIEDINGVKTNALKCFSGKFQKIPAQGSLVITVPPVIETQLHSQWSDPVIW